MTIDKAEIKCRFKRSVESYDEHAGVQRLIVCRLADLLKEYVSGACGRILEIGCGTGLLTVQIQRCFPDSELLVNDLVDAMCSKTANRCRLSPACCIVGDIEQVDLEGKFDLMVSASTFQWLADPAETLARLARCLHPNGYLAFSTFGKENCQELKRLTGCGLTYHSIRGMTELLSAHFEVVHAEENRERMTFSDPMEILRHVKKTGVNATDMPYTWTRGRLQEFVRRYAELFGKEEGYPLTYHPQYFICRKLKRE